jgi:pimeloyl-ACP methyl ester carboxylesterase
VLVELVKTQTADGLRLDGILQRARGEGNLQRLQEEMLDAVICVHGVGGNFYGGTLMERLAQVLLAQGLTVLRINTRGHDGVSTASTATGGWLQGAAYEIVDHCRHDIQSWVEFLQGQGCRRIALLGHSLGAIKAIYGQAHQPQRAVARVIAISPPRLAYSRFVQGRDVAEFRASLGTAQHWIDQNQPGMLFKATFPFPFVLSAATFVDKYGPDERYNFLELADRLRTAVDFVYGQQELDDPSSAFDGIVADIQSAAWIAPWTLEIIPDANHFYTDCIARLVEVVRCKVNARCGDG